MPNKHHHHSHGHNHGPPPPYYGYAPPPAPGAYAYVPTPVMMPMPIYPGQPVPAAPEPHPTYVTNYIYQQPTIGPTPAPQPPHSVKVVEDVFRIAKGASCRLFKATSKAGTCFMDEMKTHAAVTDIIDWIPATPSTAQSYAHKAVVAGREGWDGSPLWIIRAYHSGELIPGKLAVKHRSAYVPHAGKEVPVHNFELLCAPAHLVHWLPASHGQVPVGAIPAGNTHHAEPLYIGRVKHMRSITPGKVHPSHNCCYISFGGNEISFKQYEVLCRIVG